LLKRVFDIEHRPHCGGTLKIIAAILACPPERRLVHLRRFLTRSSQPDLVLAPVSSLHHWADLYPWVFFTQTAKKSLKPTFFAAGQK